MLHGVGERQNYGSTSVVDILCAWYVCVCDRCTCLQPILCAQSIRCRELFCFRPQSFVSIISRIGSSNQCKSTFGWSRWVQILSWPRVLLHSLFFYCKWDKATSSSVSVSMSYVYVWSVRFVLISFLFCIFLHSVQRIASIEWCNGSGRASEHSTCKLKDCVWCVDSIIFISRISMKILHISVLI